MWEVAPKGLTTGEVGDGVFVKDRENDDELEILKFLQGKGVAEELLAYDEKKIVVRRQHGDHFNEYKSQFMKYAKFRILPDSDVEEDGGFRMESITEIESSDNVVEQDELAANLCSSFIARNVFLLMFGIFHNDIKGDNIIVDNDEPILIDFGEAFIANGSVDPVKWNNNLERIFAHIADLHTDFQNMYDSLKDRTDEPRLQQSTGFPLFEEIYKQYADSSLTVRIEIASDHFKDGKKIHELLSVLHIPESLQLDITAKINRLIDISH